MENSYLFIKERESQSWIFSQELRKEHYKDGRKTIYFNPTRVYPKPEHISPFIESHIIILAKTKEEAWQNLNSK